MYPWRKGTSLSFFHDENGASIGADPEVLQEVSRHGFDCVELSFSHDEYMYKYHLTDDGVAYRLYQYCQSLGMDIWSIHLPFSDKWDLSIDDAADAMKDDKRLIDAASKAHAHVAVIHPSYEPVADADRPRRLENARENLRELSDYAKSCGMILALENLPRTCLGNTSDEMLSLLDATGASFIFDTNHSLAEDNVDFLRNMITHGYCPVSLHISDYDYIDERHDLPGHGVNRWRVLLDMLYEAGYNGPALYEIRHVVSPERIVSFDELSENIDDLLAGRIG